jgi:hypothetical protein
MSEDELKLSDIELKFLINIYILTNISFDNGMDCFRLLIWILASRSVASLTLAKLKSFETNFTCVEMLEQLNIVRLPRRSSIKTCHSLENLSRIFPKSPQTLLHLIFKTRIFTIKDPIKAHLPSHQNLFLNSLDHHRQEFPAASPPSLRIMQ